LLEIIPLSLAIRCPLLSVTSLSRAWLGAD
jgi:hypothetical protein